MLLVRDWGRGYQPNVRVRFRLRIKKVGNCCVKVYQPTCLWAYAKDLTIRKKFVQKTDVFQHKNIQTQHRPRELSPAFSSSWLIWSNSAPIRRQTLGVRSQYTQPVSESCKQTWSAQSINKNFVMRLLQSNDRGAYQCKTWHKRGKGMRFKKYLKSTQTGAIKIAKRLKCCLTVRACLIKQFGLEMNDCWMSETARIRQSSPGRLFHTLGPVRENF